MKRTEQYIYIFMQTIYKDKHPKQTNKKVNLSSIMIKKIEETKLSDIFLDKKSKMLIILDLKKKVIYQFISSQLLSRFLSNF